jgi:hypothetical protein
LCTFNIKRYRYKHIKMLFRTYQLFVTKTASSVNQFAKAGGPQIANPQICGLAILVKFADIPQMFN